MGSSRKGTEPSCRALMEIYHLWVINVWSDMDEWCVSPNWIVDTEVNLIHHDSNRTHSGANTSWTNLGGLGKSSRVLALTRSSLLTASQRLARSSRSARALISRSSIWPLHCTPIYKARGDHDISSERKRNRLLWNNIPFIEAMSCDIVKNILFESWNKERNGTFSCQDSYHIWGAWQWSPCWLSSEWIVNDTSQIEKNEHRDAIYDRASELRRPRSLEEVKIHAVPFWLSLQFAEPARSGRLWWTQIANRKGLTRMKCSTLAWFLMCERSNNCLCFLILPVNDQLQSAFSWAHWRWLPLTFGRLCGQEPQTLAETHAP